MEYKILGVQKIKCCTIDNVQCMHEYNFSNKNKNIFLTAISTERRAKMPEID